MSHNKILRTVFGISTGIMLFGMNMMQVPFASENITETEPQSISEENTDVIDNQKLLEIDQDQLDTGVVYVTTKDTYFYFPDGCSDDANLLGWAVKWMHETWYQNSENDIDVSAKERLKAAELIGKRYGMFKDNVGIDLEPVVIVNDLKE